MAEPGVPADAARRGAVVFARALALFVVFSATQPAAAETRPGYGGTLVASLLSEPVAIDPIRARSHADVTVVSLLFDTLYRVDGQALDGTPRVVPHVAAALPKVIDGGRGRRVRIAVRAGVRFHDGTELGAGDVARSLSRLLRSPVRWHLAPVRSVRAEAGSVVIELTRPAPELALLLAAPAAGITPRGEAPSWDRAFGSGPFRLKSLDRAGRSLVLAAATEHFAGRPYMDALELRWFARGDDEAVAYEAGRAHLSQRGAVAFAGHTPKYRTAEVMGPATLLVYVGFGRASSHKKLLGSVELRRALSLALERSGFRGVGTGERVVPAVHPVAAALGGPPAPDSELRARMDEARAALRRAPRPGNGVELEILIDRTRPDDREIAEKVVAALFALGVPARITATDALEFARRVSAGDCDLYIDQLPVSVPSAAQVLAAIFAAGDDSWAARAPGPLDIEHAGRVFFQRLPVVPLFHRAVRVHHRSTVRGVRMDPVARVPFADLFVFGEATR